MYYFLHNRYSYLTLVNVNGENEKILHINHTIPTLTANFTRATHFM